MPDLLDKIYCSEQIHIPPTFPYIMKLYCKAAIRTQPYDLLKWSAAYFRALANGEEPPTKERVEYPPYDSPSGLTPGYIKILINQFGKNPETTVTARTLFKKWSDICLQEQLLVRLIALLGARTTVNWVQFVGVCAGFISRSLTQTMILVCELFTDEPEGGMATVPYTLFIDLYIFLAQMECGPLTDKEKEELEAIMYEEDICVIADRIKQGIYEGEGEGEYQPPEEAGEEEMQVEAAGEERTSEGEGEISVKGSQIRGEEPDKDDDASLDKRDDYLDTDEPYDDMSGLRSESSIREDESEISAASEQGEVQPEGADLESAKEKDKEEEKPGEVEEKIEPVEDTKPMRKINLQDMDEAIRTKIEQRLAEDKESYEGEEDKEFEDLNSYLLGAAARVQKYTAESLGYRIFKKYMRQDVPGIGASIETQQVEKVVDFMDFWSNKQEQMVMPRNIRHWMCPPLDKVPTLEP
ncbi:hypothetical protein RUM44_004299 [Polyplax serrata]|uniref:Ropporin-1-like protein n=1 Tax=Polyplax serrata TaxID=468196 RepID=A0ABR1B2F9_POLSC